MHVFRERIVALASAVTPWVKKGSWSVLDQGLFAGANFVLNVLLARWLSPTEYGAFTVAFGIFLLLGMFHTALLTEPMLVFGAGQFRERLNVYVGGLLRGHVLFAVVGAAGLGLAGWWFAGHGAGPMGAVLFALAVAQPFIFFMWLVRRVCYVKLNPRAAVSGGVVYVALMLAGAFVLNGYAWLTSSTALGLMSIASFIAGIWIMAKLRLSPFERPDPSLSAAARKNHWTYGRWAMATGVLTWVTAQLAPLVLPLWAGLEGTAAFKALMNLTMPAIHAYVAFSVLLVPALVNARKRGEFRRFMAMATGLIVVAMGGYWVVLGLFGRPVMDLLYDGQYLEYSGTLWLVGFLPLLSGLLAVFAAALKSFERPDQVFWAYVWSSAAVATAGMTLIYFYGVLGAVFCQIVAMFVGAVTMAYLVATSPELRWAMRSPRVPTRLEVQWTTGSPEPNPDARTEGVAHITRHPSSRSVSPNT